MAVFWGDVHGRVDQPFVILCFLRALPVCYREILFGGTAFCCEGALPLFLSWKKGGRFLSSISSHYNSGPDAVRPFARGAGGWPRLNSEKRLWVPHPCGFVGFARVGSFSFPFSLSISYLSMVRGKKHSRRNVESFAQLLDVRAESFEIAATFETAKPRRGRN